MLIGVQCSRCGETYQVQDTLLGKQMRCPKVTCKTVFIVQLPPPEPAGDALNGPVPLVPILSSEPAPAQALSGSVPLVPILPATTEEAPSWASPPPIRRKDEPAAPPPDEPETRIDSWDVPPPVRRGKDTDIPPSRPKTGKKTTTATPPPEPAPEPVHDTPPPPRNRMARYIILPFFALVVVGMAVGGFFVLKAFRETEEKIAKEADDHFDNHRYPAARSKYEQLVRNFPNSESRDRYEFRKTLSDIIARINDQPEVIADLLDNLEQLLKDNVKKPILGEHIGRISEALVKLLEDRANRGLEDQKPTEAIKDLDKAEGVIELAKKVKVPKGQTGLDEDQIRKARATLDEAVKKAREKAELLANLEALAKEPSYRSLVLAERLIEAEGPKFPGLAESAQVRDIIDRIIKGHLERVRYDKGGAAGVAAAAPVADDEPALLPGPILRGVPGNEQRNDGIVLALSRGVLYGLNNTTGRIVWAVRVGIDTTTLPVRVPASVGNEERILVLSSDTNTLTALNVNGDTLWRYQLEAPSLGRPVVVGQRAYVATASKDGGKVHEIELAQGRPLGRFDVGHRLTIGGAHEPGSSRIYFPAEDGCVYVLNVSPAGPRCEMILYTRHLAGAVRGEPIVVSPDGDAPGYLILNTASGLRGTDLKVYDLPLRARDAAPRQLRPGAEMEGWTWFHGHHDPEKLALLTDAGVLGLFGLKQPGTTDQPLFPILPGGGLRLADLQGEKAAAPGRAAIVQVQGDDYWVLGQGRLRRLRLVWDPREGPKLVPAWNSPLEVGSPLHEGQAFRDRAGRSRLCVVTQPDRRPTTWATCVDEDRGEVQWRRQLGLVCRGEPVAITLPKSGPMLLMQDQGGALFSFDPEGLAVPAKARWVPYVPRRLEALAGALEENRTVPPVVLLGEGDGIAWVVANPGAGRSLVLRQVKPAAADRRLEVIEHTLTLPDALAGPPALAGAHILLPLADGTLGRIATEKLDRGAPEVDVGPDWRLLRAGREAAGYALGLGGDRFVSTDGGRGLTVWQWAPGKAPMMLPMGRDRGPTLDLLERTVAPPVLVPGGKATRFVAADSVGGVTLVQVQGDGSLKAVRRWEMGGQVTAGPFVRKTEAGWRVGVIVERARLVWLDPEAAEPLWSRRTPQDDAIVGTPHLVNGLLLVADQGGHYLALSPDDGEPAGKGYRLQGSVAPASAPVAFQAGRLLAPLSDGTLMLLATKRLR